MINKVPEKEDERNQALIADYIKSAGMKDGKRIFNFTMTELVTKYQISSVRIYQILKKYKVLSRNHKK